MPKPKPQTKHTTKAALRKKIAQAYSKALKAIGPRHWWPGETPFEIAIGAILTQNTAWKNVEKAIANLKKEKVLTPKSMKAISEKRLAQMIRSSGYYNMKAKKLKAFVHFLYDEFGGSLKRMAQEPMDALRAKLLAVHGIGPETADSILLYALEKPSFVVDTYTRRIFSRHNLFSEHISYRDMRDFFMEHVKNDIDLFNEFHALIVHIGHHHCKTKPLCETCPLNWIEFNPWQD